MAVGVSVWLFPGNCAGGRACFGRQLEKQREKSAHAKETVPWSVETPLP